MVIEIQLSRLYHVSENSESRLFKPRIPQNYLTRNRYENDTISRVSMSTSVEGALIGLSKDISNTILYIHEPLNLDQLKIMKWTELIDKVPDVDITGECWILEPFRSIVTGEVHVYSPESSLYYSYGPGYSGELYNWNHEIVWYSI